VNLNLIFFEKKYFKKITFEIPIHDYLKDKLDEFLTTEKYNESEMHANGKIRRK